MVRPQKLRCISAGLKRFKFKPAGVPGHSLEKVIISLDELEAIRLVDLEALYQDQAAQQMNVSRQTLGRIVASAHKKIAEALILGKSLQVEGGNCQEQHQATQVKGRGRGKCCQK